MTKPYNKEEVMKEGDCPVCQGDGYERWSGALAGVPESSEPAFMLCGYEECPVGEMVALTNLYTAAEQAGEERMREKVLKVCKRHLKWEPTFGYEDEEEKGFQKGLIAEAKLLTRDLEALK